MTVGGVRNDRGRGSPQGDRVEGDPRNAREEGVQFGMTGGLYDGRGGGAG